MTLAAGSALQLLATIAGTGGALAVHAPDDGHAVYLSSAVPGATVVIGLEDDDVRQLVAVLEGRLRALSTERRLDPTTPCHCTHPRSAHLELHGPCRASAACPCLVMRTRGTVPFGTRHAADQHQCSQPCPEHPFSVVRSVAVSFWDE